MQNKTRVPINVVAKVNGYDLPVYNGVLEINTQQESLGTDPNLIGVYYDRSGVSDALEALVDNYILTNLRSIVAQEMFSSSNNSERTDTCE
jgi:hypothetical protein